MESEVIFDEIEFELTEIITAEKKIDLSQKISIDVINGGNEYISSVWKKNEQTRNFSNGIENLGNTCYLNSVLQIFYHTPFFYYYL